MSIAYCHPPHVDLPAGKPSGIELLEAETFDLHCFQTLTGTKFLLVVEPNSPYIPAVLQRYVHTWAVCMYEWKRTWAVAAAACVCFGACNLQYMRACNARTLLEARKPRNL